ncbi:hypothetical protein BJX96DRAFT_155449 [Aspergillus floccosus]
MSLSRVSFYNTLLLLSIQAIQIPLILGAQCYWKTGIATIEEFQPCFPERANSACCGLKKKSGEPNDICTTNGLCYAQVAPYTGHILLNACTDRSWDSSDCPQICPSSMKSNTAIWLLPCTSSGKDRWCCSEDGSDCCSNDFQLDIGQLVLPATNSTSSPSNSTLVATVTSTIHATIQADSDSSSPNVTAVGAGVGVGLGACLIGTIAALWFQRRLYLKKVQELRELQSRPAYYTDRNAASAPGYRAELPSNNKPAVYELGERDTR